ncbi:GntR family transcriptional regulator [Microvirga pudoricolor]|uniref:GntR family transcriptional regulator n=1 Tax=Microvirga pudoricolor TaxID=2778729 RepID=UPI00194DD26F|nr:GntR family transcriptional regulator [Microvirga pudoricolor]MBM6595151.1 GntR family transcriptional regulator [Microvirga pudoricolor]
MNVVSIKRPRELVYETVKRRIMMNELQPGSGLTELGLAREIGCSQGTIREALLRLQEDGLVTRAGHRGTTVTRLDQEEAEETLAIRRRIEVRGALKAARNVSDEALEDLRGLIVQMEDAARQGDAFTLIELDMTFHLTLFKLSGLEALEQILTRCTIHTHRSKLWAPGHQRPLTETAHRHHALLEHLAARDASGLAQAIGDHIDTIVTQEQP